MRLLVMSDLHLEFDSFELPVDLDFDVAIFAGDIWKPIANSVHWLSLQRHAALQARPVIFVPGNHEFYGAQLNSSRKDGRELADQLGIHMLDPGVVTIGGVRFIGATLWTDFKLLGRPIAAKKAALRGLNDFQLIKIEENERFNPVHLERLHTLDLAFIEDNLAQEFPGPDSRGHSPRAPPRVHPSSVCRRRTIACLRFGFDQTHREIPTGSLDPRTRPRPARLPGRTHPDSR